MKWLLILFSVLLSSITVHAEEPKDLYAQSAVLMDAESGRVLFEKNGFEEKAMASTTKIMTCILTLEHGDLEDVVTFSKNAASQPKVHLGASEGMQFYLEDLLYSLMLESHNDTAVAIAEHIGGSVEGFADMMDQKAKEIGCENTNYVTPNGLDGSDENGAHRTTAKDLALVMSYCIKESPMKEKFVSISNTRNYSLHSIDNSVNYSCVNHNSLLSMMDGVLAGKTGYTSKAGYCYVGALENEGRTFVVALLACGWPSHKDYKWADSRLLMEYGIENYQHRNVLEEIELEPLQVENGIPKKRELYGKRYVNVSVEIEENEKLEWLLKEDEKVSINIDTLERIKAPLKSGEVVGEITYYLDDTLVKVYNIVTDENIEEIDFSWYFRNLVSRYFYAQLS